MKSRAFWAFADQMSISASNFAIGVMLARSLSVIDFEQYILIYAVIMFLISIHRAFVTQPLNTLGVTDEAFVLHQRYYASILMSLGIVGSAVAIVLTARIFTDLISIRNLVCATIFAGAFLIQDVIRRLQYTLGNVARSFWIDVLGYWLPILVICGLIFFGVNMHLEIIFTTMAIPMFVSFFFGQVFFLQKFTSETKIGVRFFFLEHARTSRWLLPTQLVFFAGPQIYPFFLATHSDAMAVATYSSCISLLNIFNILRVTVGNFMPSYAAVIYKEQGPPALRNYLFKSTVVCVCLTLCLALIIYIFSDTISSLFYNNKFPEFSSVLSFLVFLQALSVITSITDVGNLVIGKTRSVFLAYAVGAVISITIGKSLIVTFGLWGAVWATGLYLLVPCIIQVSLLILFFKSSSDNP